MGDRPVTAREAAIDAIKPRSDHPNYPPSYPPKTPPPPKKPPSPPPPQTLHPSAPARLQAVRGRTVMANRQGATWALEPQPWAGKKAVGEVTARLAKWGHRTPATLDCLVRHLIATVIPDGGKHVSLHLAEQDRQVLVLAFSHQAAPDNLDDTVLPRLHELGAVSCGTEVTADGRQVWAVLDLAP